MKNVFFFTVVTLFVVLSIEGNAQIPRTLSYQGVLTDSSGNPKPDNTYNLTFRLYENELTGSILWTEVKSLEVKRGLFSTILGDLTPLPDSLKFDHPYWLSIQVASEAELIPRIPLTPVGYSLHSVKADTANYAMNMPLQMVVDSARIASTVPDNSITSAKIVDGTIQRIDVDPSFSAPFSDTANYARQIPSINFVDSARIAGTIPDSTITRRKIPTGQVVKSLNTMADHVTLSATGGATITSSNDTITINAGSGGGIGVQGIQNINNTLDITNPNGPTVTVNVKDNLYLRKQGPDTISSSTGYGLTSLLSGNSTDNLSSFYGSCYNNSSGRAYGGSFYSGINGTGNHYGVEGAGYNNSSSTAAGVSGWGQNQGSGVAYGGYFNAADVGTGSHIGVYGHSGSISYGTVYGGRFTGYFGLGIVYGTYSSSYSSSPNQSYGTYNMALNSSTGDAYGGYFTVDTSGIGAHYGVYATINNKPNSYAGYFDGRGYFSGNVGIGNNNPLYPLDVTGIVKADTFSGDGSLLTNIHTSDWNGGGSPSALLWRTGSVGIGTSTPGAGLVVSGSGLWSSALGIENTTAGMEWRLATTNDSSFHFVKLTGSTITPLTLAANGNVGVGTITPTKTLDVNGPTHIKDILTIGSSTQDGTLQLYGDGFTFPIALMDNFFGYGGRIASAAPGGIIVGQLRPSGYGRAGALDLYRNTAGYLGFYASGNADGSGEGYMYVGGSSREVVFNMGAGGNTSIQLPDSSIAANEILDEPGISQGIIQGGSVVISGHLINMIDVDTTTITIPAPGYIVVEASAQAGFSGATTNYMSFQIDETAGGGINTAHYYYVGFSSAAPGGTTYLPVSTRRTYYKTAGIYTFRLEAVDENGTGTKYFWNPSITATYYPTSYGPVTTAVSAEELPQFQNVIQISSESDELSKVQKTGTAYQADLRELELKATRAQIAAEKAQRELMEAKMEYNQHNSDDKNK